MKQCSKCSLNKSVSEFYKDRNGKEGFRSSCKKCDICRVSNYNSNNLEKHAALQKKYYKNNTEVVKATIARYRKTDKFYSNSVYWPSLSLEYQREASLKFTRLNPGYHSYYATRRKNRIKQATPQWLTKEDLELIKDFYREAQRISEETGVRHHVDHIIPLHGENVSGLHVPNNLQILTEKENLSKGNKVYE